MIMLVINRLHGVRHSSSPDSSYKTTNKLPVNKRLKTLSYKQYCIKILLSIMPDFHELEIGRGQLFPLFSRLLTFRHMSEKQTDTTRPMLTYLRNSEQYFRCDVSDVCLPFKTSTASSKWPGKTVRPSMPSLHNSGCAKTM